jgi:enterobactin synthetase component D / holo-[acyl-carrier protein] synthase
MTNPIRTVSTRSAPVRVSRLLGELFPNGAAAFEARSPVGSETLHEEELPFIPRAVAKRAAEFATGRACARRALAQLGITGFALRVGSDREPLWPPGVTGSITHTAAFYGAVVARRTLCESLGVDVERRDAVHRRLWRQIATPGELQWLEGLAPALAADMATLLFSAKESFFKCQFPLTREWLNFSDVSVSVEPPHLRIVPCRALAVARRAPPSWKGRCALEDGLVATGVYLPAASRPSSNSAD